MFGKMPGKIFGGPINKLLVVVMAMVLAPVGVYVLVVVVDLLEQAVYNLLAPFIPVLLVIVVLRRDLLVPVSGVSPVRTTGPLSIPQLHKS